MDDLSLNLNDLEIIGYVDVLDASFVPRVVPPVFRSKKDASVVVMPPFRLRGDRLTGAIAASELQFERALGQLQATRLELPFQARPGHSLWIDESFEPHYEATETADEGLRRIARARARDAQDALIDGNVEDALRHAQTAISADESCLNALLVKALVYQLRGDGDSVEVLTELAGLTAPGADFRAWVELFSKLATDPQLVNP